MPRGIEIKMNTKIKNLIKLTPIYTIHRNKQLREIYAQKYQLTYDKVKKLHIVKAPQQNVILDLAKIENIGFGDFFYSIDSSIILDKRKNIIDNMPVDYEYILNHCFEGCPSFVDSYINRVNDSRITLRKPTSLKEALQLILFWNGLLWQTGHTLVGLGRLDKVLAPYEVPDNGEVLICNFLKTLHCKYNFKSASLLGDTGQIILLGGLNEDGSYFCNEYTYLFIKCLKKVNLPDPKILLRSSTNMPDDLLRTALDCASTGIGSPLFSNDEIVIPSLIDFGYEKKDAYNYGVSACWEPLSVGNSLEQNNLANIQYGRCFNRTVYNGKFAECKTFDDVLKLYIDQLECECEDIKFKLNNIEWSKDELLSFLMGLSKDISEGGAKYNNYGILSVGMSAAVDSLLNIKRRVFENNEFSLLDIQHKIDSNDVEEFNDVSNGFGTESKDAIELTNRLIRKTEEFLDNYRNKFGGKVKFGLSSPAYITCSNSTGATLDGRKAGEPFRTHISNDRNRSITEIMNFESKLKFTGTSCNANVIDVMVQSSLIKDNIDKFTGYLMGGIKEGIFQLQMNVLSYAQLVDAKAHPEKYPNLIVRVWGFSAYFNDLPEEYKDNLIRRAKEMEKIA